MHTEHPATSRMAMATPIVPARLVELHSLVMRANAGRHDPSHPPEHEAAWRRQIGPAMDAAAGATLPYGEALHHTRLSLILDVSMIVAAAAAAAGQPSWRVYGTLAEITRVDQSRQSASVVILRWDAAGWTVAVDDNTAIATVEPLVDASGIRAVVTIPTGTRYLVRRRTGRASGEPAHELVALPIEAQFAARAWVA